MTRGIKAWWPYTKWSIGPVHDFIIRYFPSWNDYYL